MGLMKTHLMLTLLARSFVGLEPTALPLKDKTLYQLSLSVLLGEIFSPPLATVHPQLALLSVLHTWKQGGGFRQSLFTFMAGKYASLAGIYASDYAM